MSKSIEIATNQKKKPWFVTGNTGDWIKEDVESALRMAKEGFIEQRLSFPSVAEFFDVDDLVMSTTSYYLGRMTANVGDFCRRLVQAWPNLKSSTRDYIQRIVEHEFDRESIAKRHGLTQNVFGMDCDREAWMKVRACWLTPQTPAPHAANPPSAPDSVSEST